MLCGSYSNFCAGFWPLLEAFHLRFSFCFLVNFCYQSVKNNLIINRHGAVLQSPPLLINWLIEQYFSSNIFQTLPIPYIEVGANTLKSSSSFQLPTKIMFSFNKKKHFFWRKCGNFFWQNKAHIFIPKNVQIGIFKNSDWSMFLGKSVVKKYWFRCHIFGLSPQNMNLKVTF